MPEWLSTDNIAILLLVVAAVSLWRDNQRLQKDVRQALLDGIEMEKSRTAELTSMSAVISSVQRAMVRLQEAVAENAATNTKYLKAIFRAVRS